MNKDWYYDKRDISVVICETHISSYFKIRFDNLTHIIRSMHILSSNISYKYRDVSTGTIMKAFL